MPATVDVHGVCVTARKQAARILEIDLVDHVIVGDVNADPLKVGYFSFHQQGLL